VYIFKNSLSHYRKGPAHAKSYTVIWGMREKCQKYLLSIRGRESMIPNIV